MRNKYGYKYDDLLLLKHAINTTPKTYDEYVGQIRYLRDAKEHYKTKISRLKSELKWHKNDNYIQNEIDEYEDLIYQINDALNYKRDFAPEKPIKNIKSKNESVELTKNEYIASILLEAADLLRNDDKYKLKNEVDDLKKKIIDQLRYIKLKNKPNINDVSDLGMSFYEDIEYFLDKIKSGNIFKLIEKYFYVYKDYAIIEYELTDEDSYDYPEFFTKNINLKNKFNITSSEWDECTPKYFNPNNDEIDGSVCILQFTQYIGAKFEFITQFIVDVLNQRYREELKLAHAVFETADDDPGYICFIEK